MVKHLLALAQILLVYVFLAITCLGWGKTIASRLYLGKERNGFFTADLWLGWAFVLFFFQLIHLFLPLTFFVVSPVFFLGTALGFFELYAFRKRQSSRRSSHRIRVSIVLAGIVTIVWVASRAMISPSNTDSGLYHLSAIRWQSAFPIVPGLGNLHGRLAFNQSFFSYVAALNFYPFWGHGNSVANSFLLLLAAWTFLDISRPVLRHPRLSWSPPVTASFFALPALGYLAIMKLDIASPAPDLASAMLQLVIFVFFMHHLSTWTRDPRDEDYWLFFLSVLAATAVTVKLSNAAFCATVTAVITVCAVRGSPAGIARKMTAIFLPQAIVLALWVYRGFVLSGTPLFPSTIGHVPVDWAIPPDEVKREADWVLVYSREGRYPPRGIPTDVDSWAWFWPWVRGAHIGMVYHLLLSGLFAAASAIVVLLRKRKADGLGFGGMLLLPVLVGLAFWFVAAPSYRFGMALFWCLSYGVAIIFLEQMRDIVARPLYLVVFGLTFAAVNLDFAAYAVRNGSQFANVSVSGWQPVPSVPVSQRETKSGLLVFVPKSGDQCWDSPLPCTPYFNPGLRLRVAGKLGSGFAVTSPQDDER